MKRKIYKFLLTFTLLILIIISSAAAVLAEEPYKNYIYDYKGSIKYEPQAYSPIKAITGSVLGTAELKSPKDVFVAKDGKIYIADSGNNRIIILSKDYALLSIINEFANNGQTDKFNNPQGIFVSSQNDLYIADSDNSRIVHLNAEGKLIKAIARPNAPILNSFVDYKPTKLAVDSAGRLYIVASGINKGVVELDADGSFMSFFGAISVMPTFGQMLRRIIDVKSIKDSMVLSIPTEYSSVAIDGKGFIMGTVGMIDPENFKPTMFIHRLSPSGNDILKRNGFNPPMGDVQIQVDRATGKKYTAQLCDITVRSDGIYSVLDKRSGRIFTYNTDGNLMYVFGGLGNSLGLFGMPEALDITGDNIYLVVDSKNSQIVLFKPTVYGEIISSAVHEYYMKNYQKSGEEWQKAMNYTSQSELVYDGVASVMYKSGDYINAMKYYKLAKNRKAYSMAYQFYRSQWVGKNFNLIFISIVTFVIVLIILNILFRNRRKQRVKTS